MNGPTEQQNDRFDTVLDALDDRFVARVLGLGHVADYESIVTRFDGLPSDAAETVLRSLESEARRVRALI